MHIMIEPVKRNEIQLLSQISRKTFYDSFYEYNTKENMDLFLQDNLTPGVLQTEFSNPVNSFYFAKIENEIAGFLKLSSGISPGVFVNKDVIEIARIYTLRDKIGTGVGKALMQFAMSQAKYLNRKTVWLGVWEHNLRAIRFYERFGFEKFGEHTFVLGKDIQTDWLMKKDLNDEAPVISDK